MPTEVWIDPSGGGTSPLQMFLFHDSTVEIKSGMRNGLCFRLRSRETEEILAFLRKHNPATVNVSHDVPGTALFGFDEEFTVTRRNWMDLYEKLRQAGYEKDYVRTLLTVGELGVAKLKKAGIEE